MIPRLLQNVLIARAQSYPVVTVTGPRQAGKTTLVKASFPEYRYVNLERPSDRDFAIRDPQGFFRTYPPPVILDEIQRVPDLLSWIQVMADDGVEPGSFILTGSNQPAVGADVAQSLAGSKSACDVWRRWCKHNDSVAVAQPSRGVVHCVPAAPLVSKHRKETGKTTEDLLS